MPTLNITLPYFLSLFQVQNELRGLTLKVFIRVPVKLGDIDIWTNSNLQVCEFISHLTSHTGILINLIK